MTDDYIQAYIKCSIIIILFLSFPKYSFIILPSLDLIQKYGNIQKYLHTSILVVKIMDREYGYSAPL